MQDEQQAKRICRRRLEGEGSRCVSDKHQIPQWTPSMDPLRVLQRDVMTRLFADQKTLLETRFYLIDIAGLFDSLLVGKTHMQYAGSLTGRDFCAIVQVAPFVLCDLVPPECYETWLTISLMLLLVWQPKIQNINTHIVCHPYCLQMHKTYHF